MINHEELLWLDDAQSLYLSEVSFVECGYLIAATARERGDNQVVRTNHFAGGLQRRPDSRMFIRCLLRIGNDRQGLSLILSADLHQAPSAYEPLSWNRTLY